MYLGLFYVIFSKFQAKCKQIPKEVRLLDEKSRVEETTQKGAKMKKKGLNHRPTMKTIVPRC
jgi:hypothetical protein